MDLTTLKQELREAIQHWRKVWKSGDVEGAVQLYTENVRVLRSGIGLLVGRDELRRTLSQLSSNLAWHDIDWVTEEVGSINGDVPMAYERFREALLKEDGSEIATIYGIVIWKKVDDSWLIDMYANCPVASKNANNTAQLQANIQQEFMKLSSAWSTQDANEVLKFFSDDCLFMPPGEVLRGKESIHKWLEAMFAKDWHIWTATVESVISVSAVYLTSQMVYVNYPSFAIQDSSGKVVVQGSGNAMVKRKDTDWEICEAVWNFQ